MAVDSFDAAVAAVQEIGDDPGNEVKLRLYAPISRPPRAMSRAGGPGSSTPSGGPRSTPGPACRG
ncbi:MAG: hypothetical protein R2734_06620 [Nocardioides sp.]